MPVLSVVLGGSILLSGCGIPTDDEVTLARPESVPFDLLAPAPSTTTTVTTAPSAPTVRSTIFLVEGERLARVVRELVAPVAPGSVLDALSDGPTDAEAARGLRSALLAEGLMRSVGVAGGIATVDLGSSFSGIVGRDQILALAQIVATLTGLPGVGRVSFTLEGNPVGVPRGDGAITTDSVSRDDYAALAPAG